MERPAWAAAFCGLLLVALLAPATAGAKSTRTVDYPFEAVWSTAIRLLRADRGYKITDQDRDNGFILFVYPGSGSVKECPASLELLPGSGQDGTRRTRLQLGIAHQPSYIEVALLEALERKLVEEQGPPPAPQREKKPPSEPAPPKSGAGKEDEPR